MFRIDSDKSNDLHVLRHSLKINIGDVDVPIFGQFIIVVMVDELTHHWEEPVILLLLVTLPGLPKENNLSAEEGGQVSCVLYPSGPPRNTQATALKR